MVRQYIGARYVTKIYENSNDPSSAEWESSVNYEPLTMVTYNNGSYLSKKEVPASIGNPAANPAYWVQTGFYNGQIASLQAQIDELKNTIVTPEMFGAVGDGVTDDLIPLQNAFNTHLPVMGVAGKRYYSSGDIYAYNDIYNIDLIFALKKMLHYERVNDVIVSNSNFEMLGRITDPDDRGQYAITFWFCNNVRVKNCYFNHFTSNIIFNVTSNISVNDNYFYDSYQNATLGNGYGVVLQCCKDVTIANNHFKDVQRHSVYISYQTEFDDRPEFVGYHHWCENVNVIGNIFEITDYDHGGYNLTSTEHQVKCIASKNVNINNNQFIGTYGAVFFVPEENAEDYCENIAINNNIIENQVSDARAIILELWRGVNYPINKNISICGNIFHNSSDYPCIKFAQVDGLIISDNIVKQDNANLTSFNYLCAFYHEGSGATISDTCYKNIKISNNSVYNKGLVKWYTSNASLSFGAVDDVEISDNNVYYPGYIIMNATDVGKITNLKILNNTLKGSASSAIALLDSAGMVADNIIVIGNDLSGNSAIFGSSFSGLIYFLNNINYGTINNGLPTTAITDIYDKYVVATGSFDLPADAIVGTNEIAVTFDHELRVTPNSIHIIGYDSINFFGVVGGVIVKNGTLSATGFTAIVNKIANSGSVWTFRYIAIGSR